MQKIKCVLLAGDANGLYWLVLLIINAGLLAGGVLKSGMLPAADLETHMNMKGMVIVNG